MIIFSSYQVFYQFPGSKMQANSIFLPLGYDVWITLGAWIFLGAIALYVGCYLTDRYLGTNEDFELSRSFHSILGALCGQGNLFHSHFPSRLV